MGYRGRMLRGLIVTLALLGLTLPAQASEWALEEWLAEHDSAPSGAYFPPLHAQHSVLGSMS